jgi:hypothetical protein
MRGTGRLYPLLVPLTAAARRYLTAFDDALAHPESETSLDHRTRMFLVIRGRLGGESAPGADVPPDPNVRPSPPRDG